MSLLFNILFQLVITFLPRSKCLLSSWLQSPSAVILEPPKIKNQFFSPVICLGPNYGGSHEDNGNLLQKVPCMHCYTQCPQPCSRPPPTDASAGNSWASLGQSLVGLLLLSPGSWCTQGSVCALQQSTSQSFVSSCSSMVGLMVTSSKKAYAIPKSAAPRAPAPAAVHY